MLAILKLAEIHLNKLKRPTESILHAGQRDVLAREGDQAVEALNSFAQRFRTDWPGASLTVVSAPTHNDVSVEFNEQLQQVCESNQVQYLSLEQQQSLQGEFQIF